jgi:hypothetical protein
MSKARYCHDCTNYTATQEHPMDVCRLKHKPRFYRLQTMSQAHTNDWGWKKQCTDFFAWVKGDKHEL